MKSSGCTIRLPVFEGPFDLLFHLVSKAEVDIWSVSIAEITDQYLNYLRSLQELNLDLASEFLVMAATLLRLKSKLLLPPPPREEMEEEEELLFGFNSPQELFQRLEEYRQIKEAAGWLKGMENSRQKIYLRSTGGKKVLLKNNRQQSYYTLWEGVEALGQIMKRYREQAAAQNKVYLPTERSFLRTKITQVLRRLRRQAGPVTFKTLIEKGEIVYTFIALLELARRQRITLFQERLFGTILVFSNRQEGNSKHGSS